MRIDQLDVVLRARSQWEAMELGTALVRRHAAAIWKPWLLLTLPVFALLNLLGWWLDNFWLSSLILWWLKPAFERIPLYVISRGAFGAEPSTGQTLRAQWNWGWRGVVAYLGWRRLSPARSLLMPVDLLEGGDATQRRARRHALGGASYGHATLLTWVCWHFEMMLQLAGVALVFMFVPVELLSESLRATWELIGTDTPAWAWIGFNLLAWLAMTLIGPFYSGAGFGLYLNRRTQLEAWDVEIAFRRLRDRLAGLAPMLVLLLAVFALPSLQARAQDSTEPASISSHGNHKDAAPEAAATATATTPQQLFGTAPADTNGFRQAAARAYEDPQLGAKRKVSRWVKKASDKITETKQESDKPDPGPILGAIAKAVALIGESILWILLGVLLVVLALTARWWLPWLRGSGRSSRVVQAPAIQEALQLPEVLPPDILGSARRLWREGKPRHALALLYRASVDVLVQRGNVVLPPGATEAQCLRASRKMPQEADRTLFARMVRTWQYAAYAGRLPSDDEFNALISELHQHYGWPA
ncbi:MULTISPECIES: DUF4129 domain-containing protein [Stenotrophomonas]|uniref:DUF4129 domain-containing protein n=1 Tax=Stenotrophomonas TaxID=40323 RepID=UPI000770606B|nr:MULTISPECIES: DUF4129 domain-containing protein [Stenotrophomonas]AMJ58489.1 hypothetical protein AXG53_19110 [Stenotrophomonas sp. KCTC 12332]